MKKMFHNFEIIEQSEISEYKYPGVWAMFGIKKGDNSSKYICLNVGKNKCIGDELKIDFERLECFMPFRKKYIKINLMKKSSHIKSMQQDKIGCIKKYLRNMNQL